MRNISKKPQYVALENIICYDIIANIKMCEGENHMIQCKKCGNTVMENTRFCPACGSIRSEFENKKAL